MMSFFTLVLFQATQSLKLTKERIKFGFCLYLFVNKEMETCPNSAKLRKSLQTSYTSSDHLDSSIKIRIKNPLKIGNQNKLLASPSQIQQIIYEQQPSISQIVERKDLLKVPTLVWKLPQASFFEFQNLYSTKNMQSSNTLDYRSFDCHKGSINWRNMNITNSSEIYPNNDRNVSAQKNIQIPIKIQQTHLQQVQNNNSDNSGQINIQNNYQELQSKQEINRLSQSNSRRQVELKQIVSQLKLSSKYDILRSSKSARQYNESGSKSRIQMRDFIYTIKAANKNTINHPLTLQNRQTPKTLLSSKKNAKHHPLPHFQKLQQSKISSKRSLVRTKYNVPNSTMFNVLKKQITIDMKKIEQNIKIMNHQLSEIQLTKQPQNQQLSILYDLRSQLNQQINKKLEAAIESIRKQKKSHHLQCRPYPRLPKEKNNS